MRRMRLLGWLALLCCLSGCATTRTLTQQNGVVRGNIGLPKTASASDKASLAQAVVYVEDLEQTTRPDAKTAAKPDQTSTRPGVKSATKTKRVKEQSKRLPEPVKLFTSKNQFNPPVLAVRAGTTVQFHNHDRVYHNAFSRSQAKRFDIGKYGPGERRSVTFDKTGVVNLFCDLHPEASAFVVVLPNDAFAQVDATGAFELPRLPSGTYTVKAWHPRYGERRARVEVPRSGDVTVHLRF